MIYADRMNLIKASAIRDAQKKIAAHQGKVISFAAGLPDPALFPMKDLTAVTSKIMETEGAFALQYGPTKGEDVLLDALVERMAQRENIQTARENIIITTGSQQGIAMAAMVFLNEGDIVVVENPSYLGGINACRPYGCDFIGVDTDDEGMRLDELEKALKENPKVKMLYVIPNFQNPTGKSWSLQRRKDFMALVNKYDVVVLEDNPYGEIRFEGEFVPTLKSMDTEDKVIYLGSFSKVLCPGLRVAWACGKAEYIDKIETLKQGIDLQSNQFAQIQVYEYLKNCDLDAHVEEIKKEYKKRCTTMLDTMEKYFPEGVKYTRPEGGMFIWVELPNGLNSTEVLNHAIDAGVAYVPGESFYANDGATNTMRLNYTTMPEEDIVEGIQILAKVFADAMK